MSDLLSKFLVHYDPLRLGCTRRGIANGMLTTCGLSFPRLAGGHNAYLGESPGTIDRTLPVGACGPADRSIRIFDWLAMVPGTHYVQVVGIGPGGVESVSGPIARVVVNAAGWTIDATPPSPARLTATAIAGGRIRLRWAYTASPTMGKARRFGIASDGGSGEPDPANWSTVGTVAVRAAMGGTGPYGWDSAPYADGLSVRFIVAAIAGQNTADPNQVIVSAVADASGPAGERILAVQAGDDQ